MTNDPPETYVVWRKEVALLNGAEVDAATLRDWFRACRIEARERLRDRTDRVRQTLEDLLKGSYRAERFSQRNKMQGVGEMVVTLSYRLIGLRPLAG